MIQLLNVDCMEYMAGLPDNAFDLAVVDPPYGIGQGGDKNASRGGVFGGGKVGKVIPAKHFRPFPDIRPPPEYFSHIKRVSKNQVVWGGNHFGMPGSSCWLVWDKQTNGDFADCELAWTSFKSAVRKFEYRWNGMLQADMKNKEYRIHPTQKPMRLYQWILENYAKPGQRILDTHLGSGSSAIAAHYFGCDFVGCEIDTDYYNAACERFDMETRQQAMF